MATSVLFVILNDGVTVAGVPLLSAFVKVNLGLSERTTFWLINPGTALTFGVLQVCVFEYRSFAGRPHRNPDIGLTIDFHYKRKPTAMILTIIAVVVLDVLAAVRYLRGSGAKTVSVIGASFGGGAAAKAAVEAAPGEIDRLILLAHAAIKQPERMKGRKLFITTRGDFSGGGVLRLPGIREQYQRSPQPKELLILEGSAHAQHIFKTEQGERLMQEIQRFLSEP